MSQINNTAKPNKISAQRKLRTPKSRLVSGADLLSVKDAAAHLGRSESCMGVWRWKNTGPGHTKILGRVWYKRSDLDAFLKAATVYKRGAM